MLNATYCGLCVDREMRVLDVFGDPIDADRINAEFRDGVLTVTVPRAAQAQARRIPVE